MLCIVTTMFDDQLTLVEREVLALAEAMPANRYGFVPTGEHFRDARTFGEQVRHTATMIYMTAALVREEKSPHGPGTHNNGPDGLETKEASVSYLREALAYARRAVADLTAGNASDPVPTAFGAMPRSAVAAGIAYHSFNHYGQMVVYARLNGVQPPASVPPDDEPGR
jgi:hypothetical protein